MVNQELLLSMAQDFDADFERGILYSKKPNNVKREIGSLKRAVNRVYVYYKSQVYLRYRILFALYHGYWPSKEIDHIDGISTNDSIHNLREVDRQTNTKNCKIRRDNTSGITGVTFQKDIQMWRVKVGSKHIGIFKDLDEAIACRNKAQQGLGYTERHGK